MQGVHVEAPAGEIEPAGQTVTLTPEQNEPATQAVHDVNGALLV